MAFGPNLQFSFAVQESFEADAFRLRDTSINWLGEQADVTGLDLSLTLPDGTILAYDIYAQPGQWDAFLAEGCIITIADLQVLYPDLADKWVDGVYIFLLTLSGGTYVGGDQQVDPTYENYDGFLMQARQRYRFVPTKIPLENNYHEVRDFYLCGMYLDCAETAADVGEVERFQEYVDYSTAIFDKYEVEQV